MNLEIRLDKAVRVLAAVLLCGTTAVPARALTYGGGLRYIDLDTRGSRGQVQEYDGKLYKGAHGDVSVSNQGTEGLFDFSMKDIGSTEEEAALNVDHKSGFRMSGKFQNMHHRLNYLRVGELHRGVWIPKQQITLRGVTETQELVMRRSEAEFNFIKTSISDPRHWLTANPEDRKGAKGKIVKSNRTDNESAKMATSKGVIQGYCGVAAVDAKHQIIVDAQAHGTGNEQALLLPVVKAVSPLCTPDTLITADAGYHSEANLKALAEQDRPALIADNLMRKRDERFKDQAKYKAQPDPLYDKAHPKKTARHYRPVDFEHDPEKGTCICPAGKSLYQNGTNCIHNGHIAVKFQGALRDCVPCTQRDKCLRTPEKTKTRQVCFFRGKAPGGAASYTDLMRRAIDSERGRALYGGRFATVEPVFGNIRHNKGLDRFTLRGQKKVDTQWKLYCLVHNIEKLAHHGYAIRE